MQGTIERGFFKSEAIRLDDAQALSNQPAVQVLRVGKFNHPKYGEFEITKATLAEMKANFDNKVRGVDIAFDYFHNSDQEAAGWPRELYLQDDGTSLWAKVDWTPTAMQKLSEREIRYFSPDFAFEWKDPESGKIYKNVLFGGGLTNRPFVKDMAAIVAAEEREQTMLKELQEKLVKLSEDMESMKKEQDDMKKKQAEMKKKPPVKAEEAEPKDDPNGDTEVDTDQDDDGKAESAKEIESLKAELAEAKKMLAEYAEKEKAAVAAKVLAEKETAFTVLLSEGKACVAQKEAYISGDMDKFIKLAQPINLGVKGSATATIETEGDREDRVLKLAEEMCKKDAKLSKVDAIKLANKEIK